ncbi:NADH-quinone oxidoreductase subunit NuoG [Geomonas sp. Red276]
MPKLTIDNIPVEVPQGTSVLEAARSVGITIPHFCYHPALAIAAACRLCAVKLLDGPVKGIQMSCSLAAQDGMVVSTTDPEAMKLRSLVIEWLMINHPHDCPVCDEGGECLLQDFTIAGGHGRRRYQGNKRTHMNQYLGEGICHEMNRCIQCYRCVRFYQEYAGGTDFGVMGSAGRVYFGRFEEGQLESPFSGNLVDICPTGVFTDKTGRFRARYWDYQFSPAVCQHCSVGCNTSPQAFQRELIKIVGRRNDNVNGWFICDRGRFDKEYLNTPLRPRDPMVDGTPCEFEEALAALAARIADLAKVHGPESIAVVGSPRLSLESALMLTELAEHLKGATLSFYADAARSEVSLGAVKLLNEQNAATVRDLEGADCVVLYELDLIEEGAMLAPAVRKAAVRGAQVYLVSSGPLTLSKPLPFAYRQVASLDEVIIEGGAKGVVICGAAPKPADEMAQIASLAAKLMLLQPGPNGFAAAMVAIESRAVPLAEVLSSGKVKALLAFEPELPDRLPEGVTLLACADWRASELSRQAAIFLPTATWIESDGTAVNFEGRAQRFQRSFRAGLPLKGLDPKYYQHQGPVPPHPPRIPHGEIPGGKERDCWKVVAQLIEKMGGGSMTEPLTGKWGKLRELDPEAGGVRVFGLNET